MKAKTQMNEQEKYELENDNDESYFDDEECTDSDIVGAKSLEDFFDELPNVTELSKDVVISDRLVNGYKIINTADGEKKIPNYMKFTCGQMSLQQLESYRRLIKTDKQNRTRGEIDFYLSIVKNHCLNPNFKNAELIKKSGCLLPEDYIQKKLTVGEIQRLAQEILGFNGFNKTINELKQEVKNS
ncbi:MAG: hypothetical protein Q8876_07930 [Bacillota bacterium]|nr:hypothetical protein [Bacillota bacterium]